MSAQSPRPHSGGIKLCPDPVFVLGAPRSGKTTLAGALAAHSEFWTSAETLILPELFGEGRPERLAERLLARPSATWLRVQNVDREEFLSYLGLGVNALFTDRSGGKRWIDHTAGNTFMADTLMAMFPGASLIHVVRDGRLVVESMLDVERKLPPEKAKAMREGRFLPRWTSDFGEACRTWSSSVEAGMGACDSHPGRCLTVRFDDLMNAPAETFAKVLDALGVPDEQGPAEQWRKRRAHFEDEETNGSAQWERWSSEQRQVFLDEAGSTFVACGLGSEADLAVDSPGGGQAATRKKTESAPTRKRSPSAAGPDFIGIGAQKSATTFVYEVLKRHPQVVFPATRERFNPPPIELDGRQVVTWPKEIRFLHGENERLSWDEYLSLFGDKGPDERHGEITPYYLLTPRPRIQELRERVPDVRLFVILRDPVQRDWSSIRMVAARRGELDDPDALRRIATFGQIQKRGDYVGSLTNWLSVFPREQLLILPYERLRQDPVSFLRAICDHLGVPVDPIAEKTEKAVYEGEKVPLPEDLHSYLVRRHRGITEKLEDLCGIDFADYWSPALRQRQPTAPGETASPKAPSPEPGPAGENILLVDPEKIRLWYPGSAPADLTNGGEPVRGGDWDGAAEYLSDDSDVFRASRERLNADAAQSSSAENGVGELKVAINRDGRFILLEAPERLALARMANLSEVTTKVAVRHQEWMNFKDEIRTQARYAGGRLIYQTIDHPDLINIPAHKTENRIKMIREALADYDCEGKTLIDIGAQWGYMAQQMEKLGFECTAIELKDDAVHMAQKIRTATESRFAIWHGDFCEFPDPTADVVLALNIFHHPIKTKAGHARLVEFLSQLSTTTLFFQTARSGEEQMAGAYRNFEQREFAEFVAEHAGLANVEDLGPSDGNRHLYKLTPSHHASA